MINKVIEAQNIAFHVNLWEPKTEYIKKHFELLPMYDWKNVRMKFLTRDQHKTFIPEA